MQDIKIPKTDAKEIDKAKRKLEIRFTPEIKSIFYKLANDCEILYKADQNISVKDLVKQYTPEFISSIRKMYRRTIKEFGYEIRKQSEAKYFVKFGEDNSKILDIEYKQTINIQDDQLDDKINDVNNKFLQEALFFIQNEPEKKTEYILETNDKMVVGAIATGLGMFLQFRDKLQYDLLNAENDKQRQVAQDKLDKHNANEKVFVAREIAKDIKKKAQRRAELITEDAVGTSEAWGRQKEAELINEAQITISQTTVLKVKKKWVAILDSKTRSTHAQADGQVVDVNEYFLVGGHQAKTPRDTNLPPAESINCRCVADYNV